MGIEGEGMITRKELSKILTDELDKIDSSLADKTTQINDMQILYWMGGI